MHLILRIGASANLVWLQIDEKQKQLSAARKQLKGAKAEHKASHDDRSKK